MPPKKKQTPKNAFFYFMMEFKDKHGKKYNSMQEVSDAAGPHWSNMSKEQRRPYEQKALMEKNHVKPVKLTSEGLDIEELEMMEKQEQMKIQEMKDEINYTLNMSNKNGRIKDELFFIIHINHFCYCESEGRYYPAEIAISCFSLEDGVLPQNVFHRCIQPGMLPRGYAHDANLRSKESHQLPPPMYGENENNMEEVYMEMKHFLQTKLSGSKRMPVLYADEKMVKMVQHVLDMWCYDFHEQKPLFKVFNLQYMFRLLRNIVAGYNVWVTDTYSAREIEKDVYAYTGGLSCEIHEVSDVVVHCSRSIVIRYAYIICDNCCPDLHIVMVPGTHVPDTALMPGRSASRANSICSASSTRSSKLRPSTREDDSDSLVSFSSRSEWDNSSVTSSSHMTLESDDQFPLLGGRGGRNKPPSPPTSFHHYSPDESSEKSSVKSYSGATGRAGMSQRSMDLPSSVMKNDEKYQPSASLPPSDFWGRGRPLGESQNRDNAINRDDVNSFPALGRARGLGTRGRRPNRNQ
ncbi:unnamed protein product [Phaedon cochleariae]|uniref:HMG box domain-containing protein n=1 Tax=Phaedon cochleariae TaxID=80249 RepID=A0A9N9SH24_PHACE|nr:unnamed protein product [Phaedon cochleariae]